MLCENNLYNSFNAIHKQALLMMLPYESDPELTGLAGFIIKKNCINNRHPFKSGTLLIHNLFRRLKGN